MAEILWKKGYAANIKDAFNRYVGDGKPGNVEKEKLAPKEAVVAIRQAGGVPVLAYPRSLKLDPLELEKLVVRLKTLGLVGMEVYYSENTAEETETLTRIASTHERIITGGSDFHWEDSKPGINLGTGYGNLRVDAELLAPLKAAANTSA